MARLVTLTRDMRPWRAGQDVALQDDALAAMLIASGEAKDSRPFPPADVAPRVPVGRVAAPIPHGKGRFMNRKRA